MSGGIGMYLRSFGAPTLPERAPEPKKKAKVKTEVKKPQRTYREWQELGYQVQRGERAFGRSAGGEATFLKEQVMPRKGRLFRGDDSDEPLWNGMTETEFLRYMPGAK